ncbi:FAD-binding oxidoreductase [Cognatazoarcus halotolerans]|uniref:FAD-binding oxidoreductase n=1 Tax=Cognatazoarcus halotolerans TaxID=2686016 RepID=UPI0013575332|nr:FAD-binding oxidoreductase [Cognatazoarcus halotolerans]MBX3680240.1 FAD-binding oxidoreductase [Rhodocyclaceae bacterium]MCB1902377.1 FAD-binding oxidoreductase [Rhodocyclaceae bacterium]MCP5309655.1 FAD-binding oxidoreductase [Zoogloeaceae bacterium]
MADPFLACLAELIGESNVLVEAADMAPYLTDWRGRYSGRARAVARPGSARQLAEIMARCYAAGIPMVPQGGNTGLCGGATPRDGGDELVISLGRLNRIRELDPANNTLIAEAGCTLAAVQEAAASIDRLFPLSLASEGSCQIGGNLSTNAGGVHVLRYGNARDLVLGVEAVLPDGRLWNGLRGLRKNNTGYDLKQLLIGAEGTLGIITAAVLKLFPRPRALCVAWVELDSPALAVDLLGFMQSRTGNALNSFELIGREALDLVLRHLPGARSPVAERGRWAVLIELADGGDEERLREVMDDALSGAFDQGLITDAVIASSLAQSRALWHLRENISEAQRLEGVSIKHDVSVPVSLIPAFLESAGKALCEAFPGIRVVAFGHLGDGNLHYNLSKPDSGSNAHFIDSTPTVNRIVHDLVVSFGGSISAEHGLGQLKRTEILRYRDPEETAMMVAIKQLFDPRGLMNPGKVI